MAARTLRFPCEVATEGYRIDSARPGQWGEGSKVIHVEFSLLRAKKT